MNSTVNQYGQPIGEAMPSWHARPAPADVTLQGTFCRLESINAARHANDLYAAYSSASDGRDWTYMFAGPFHNSDDYRRYVDSICNRADPKHFAVIDTNLGKAVGDLSLMRTDSGNGVTEVGHVAFSPLLKQKPASTEAQFLLMKYVFEELKYRRYEWKCDSLNAPSRTTAERLGFRFEGIFRQAIVYKGRSRDTAWYSVIDREWPLLRDAFLSWLAAKNFDSRGRQIRTLVEIRNERFKSYCSFAAV